MIGLLALGLVGCGGGGDKLGAGDLSFEDMCDQGATKMCDRAASCGSTQPKADCIAQGKAMNCAGGVEQYCGVGMSFQSSKVAACLDALDALACTALNTVPTACTPEVLCVSQGGSTPVATPGEACLAVGVSTTCEPEASLCYAAGTASSCPNKELCVGDAQGMTCAARCTVDTDCLSAGTGLVCLQDCATLILKGFCMKPKAKAKFVEYECGDSARPTTPGAAGWAL